MKPDYARIAELERDLGFPPSAETVAFLGVNRIREESEPSFRERYVASLTGTTPAEARELDAAVVEAWQLLTWRHTASGVVVNAGRLLFWLALGFAAVWLCLMAAGVVPWSS